MADRAKLIESQHFNSKWQDDNIRQYHSDIDWQERFGSSRGPHRNFAMPILNGVNPRASESLRQMNVWQTRYHHPGGLQYRQGDMERMLNSKSKLSRGDNYIDATIEVTPGIWAQGF